MTSMIENIPIRRIASNYPHSLLIHHLHYHHSHSHYHCVDDEFDRTAVEKRRVVIHVEREADLTCDISPLIPSSDHPPPIYVFYIIFILVSFMM